jgi:Uma2 family endonuclease
MSRQPESQYLTPEDYLAGELVSETRHEYIDGETYAMVGASDRHNLIAGNLFASLHPHIRGSQCQLFMSDMKVRLNIAGEDAFYYPDLMLCCDPADRETYYRRRPCLLVEVMSESTERIDRREKLLAYTQIESLQAYLLLSQDRQLVEIHRHRQDWRIERQIAGELTLECLGLKLAIEQIYAGVDFPHPITR